MGWAHLVYVIWNFRTLGRLHARLQQQFPGTAEQIWKSLSALQRFDIVLGPAVFGMRAALLNLAVAHPERLPVYILGNDEIARLVRALNQSRFSGLYRWLDKATGFSY